jgi:threonine dehydrogenase-like Zn-dependent dehydrogenase
MKNKFCHFTAPQSIEIKEIHLKELDAYNARVRFFYCGICGSDYSIYLGRRNVYPESLGHEFVGEVIQVGSKVNNVKPGEFVVSDFNYRCGECAYCKSEHTHLCVSNNIQKFSNRGFAQYSDINANYLFATPYRYPEPQACFIEPLSCVIHAIDQCNITNQSRVLVVGCGNIGTMVCFYLQMIKGLKDIDVLENNSNRLAKVKQCFDIEEVDCNKKYDCIIECSNSISGMKSALDHTPCGGCICIISHLYGLETSFIYEQLCTKEIHAVFPLRNGNERNMHHAINYIYDYWVSDYSILFEIYESVHQAFKDKEGCVCNKQIVRIETSSL